MGVIIAKTSRVRRFECLDDFGDEYDEKVMEKA
jgi:hypothetical protein